MRAEDRAGFTDFVSAEQAALLRLAVLLTGNRGSAEDLVQTALTACYRHWPRVPAWGFSSRGPAFLPKPWCRRRGRRAPGPGRGSGARGSGGRPPAAPW